MINTEWFFTFMLKTKTQRKMNERPASSNTLKWVVLTVFFYSLIAILYEYTRFPKELPSLRPIIVFRNWELTSQPGFKKVMEAFPWEDFERGADSSDPLLKHQYAQMFITLMENFIIMPPKVPVNESCKVPPPLTPVTPEECGKHPDVFLTQVLQKPRKIVHGIQLGFDVDTLEIFLNEIDGLVDYFFIVETPRTHCAFYAKRLIWDQIKFQPRFDKFRSKVVHIVLDELSLLEADKEYKRTGDKWVLENRQERIRWQSIKRWNELTGFLSEDDLVGLGDGDEIPSRANLNLLRNCALKNPTGSIDIGIWFPYGNIHQAFETDWPVNDSLRYSLGDPTYFPVRSLIGAQAEKSWGGFDYPSRMRGKSALHLLGGMHMTNYLYLPFLLVKGITMTECSGFRDGKMIYNDYTKFVRQDRYDDMHKLMEQTPARDPRIHYISDVIDKVPSLKEIVVFPWFYNCNRDRYPSWESKNDTRLD